MWRSITFLVLMASTAQAMLPFSCYRSLMNGSGPAPFDQFPRDSGDAQFRAMHWSVLSVRNVSPQAARPMAERLLGQLEQIAARLKGSHSDAVLKEILETLYSGELLEGTGYRLHGNILLTGRPHDGWVTPDTLPSAYIQLATSSSLKAGCVNLPFFEETNHSYEMLTASDKHDRALYVEKIRLCLVTYLCVVQYLRLYGGSEKTQVNVSAWARSSKAPFVIDLTADALMWLRECTGEMP